MPDGGLEYHEVKGKQRYAEWSVPKLKAVAHLFPDFVFKLVWAEKRKGKGVSLLPAADQYEFTETEVVA